MDPTAAEIWSAKLAHLFTQNPGGEYFMDSPNKPHSDPGSPLTVPTTNATHPSPSSCYVRQCFLAGNSHWMKWEKLDIAALEKDAPSTANYVHLPPLHPIPIPTEKP